MFSMFFKKSERDALRAKIASTQKAMELAMRRHGINSSQAREFDKQLDKLEYELAHAA